MDKQTFVMGLFNHGMGNLPGVTRYFPCWRYILQSAYGMLRLRIITMNYGPANDRVALAGINNSAFRWTWDPNLFFLISAETSFWSEVDITYWYDQLHPSKKTPQSS